MNFPSLNKHSQSEYGHSYAQRNKTTWDIQS